MRSIALLAAIGLSGCASTYTITSLRTPYPGPEKLEINCATYAGTDEADINQKLTSLYAGGWRLASSGSYGSNMFGSSIFLCFERPAEGHPRAERRPVRHEQAVESAAPAPAAAAPEPAEAPTPAAATPDSAPSSAAPSDGSSSSTTPTATAPSDSQPSDSSSETPHRRRPVSGE